MPIPGAATAPGSRRGRPKPARLRGDAGGRRRGVSRRSTPARRDFQRWNLNRKCATRCSSGATAIRCRDGSTPIRPSTGSRSSGCSLASGCSSATIAKSRARATIVTLQIGDYPLLVVRGRDGAIRAFHNSCRHRGSRVCASERRVRRSRLVCPYHNWSYDLDGRLLFARDMGRRLRSQAARAEAGPLRERRRLRLDLPRARAARFRAVPRRRGALSRAASARRGEDRVREHDRRERQLEARLGEQPRMLPLRAATIPSSAAPFPRRRRCPASTGAMTIPSSSAHWERCEAAGLPSRFEISRRWAVSRRAHAAAARRGQLHACRARRRCAGRSATRVDEPKIGALLLFHYPSTWNHVLGDHAVIVPRAADRAEADAGDDQMAGAPGRRRGRGLFARRTDRGLDSPPTTRTGASSRKTRSASPRRPSSRGPTTPCTRAA